MSASLDDTVYEMNGTPIQGAAISSPRYPVAVATIATVHAVTPVGYSMVNSRNFDDDTMQNTCRISENDVCADGTESIDNNIVVADQYCPNNSYYYETDVTETETMDDTNIDSTCTADNRCIIHGWICCYSVVDCNCDIIGVSHSHDCLCIRFNYCFAYNHKPYGCDFVGTLCDGTTSYNNENDNNDAICSVQLYCIELGIIVPTAKYICKYVYYNSCFCIQNVGSFPTLHPNYITNHVVAYHCIQCCPRFGCGFCVTPPTYSRHMESLLLDNNNVKRRSQEEEHLYTLPSAQIEMLRD
jgi:hypothetical protein